MKTGSATYTQCITYIGKINSFGELHYYFDISKISDAGIENRFRNVFEANAEELFNTNKSLFSSINISSTSKIDSWTKLEAVVKDKELLNSLIGKKIIKLE